MNMKEYLTVKNLTYLEYCNYLQAKYGIGLANYMTDSYYPNPKCKRANKDGLFAHHKMEDRAICLSAKIPAMRYPFEWQLKENIVYCDYLEHLLLHVLITKYPADDRLTSNGHICITGVYYVASELDELYKNTKTDQKWKETCFNRVKDDKNVYIELLRQFKDIYTKPIKDFRSDEKMLTLMTEWT